MVDEPRTTRNVTAKKLTEVERKAVDNLKDFLPHIEEEKLIQSVQFLAPSDGSPLSEETMSRIITQFVEEPGIIALPPPSPPMIGPLQKPETSSTGSDTMDIAPLLNENHQNITSALEQQHFDTAVMNSMTETQSPSQKNSTNENEEEMVRDWNKTCGLKNQGNTCWFNSLTQMLFSLPKFRSFIHHSPPLSWHSNPITNVQPQFVVHAELLLRFRRLLAEMQFSEQKYLVVGELLVTVDKLYTALNHNSSTIGAQQDASEMLILIMDWLGTAIDAAIFAHENPLYSNCVDDNLVVSDSHEQELNDSAPPGYQKDTPIDGMPCTSSIQRDPKSRANSPVRPGPMRDAHGGPVPKSPRNANALESVDEAMDTSDWQSKSTEPPVPSHPRSSANREVEGESSAQVEVEAPVIPTGLIKDLREGYAAIFQSTLRTFTLGPDGEVVGEPKEEHSCPVCFHLQLSFGNLHDALEACTYSSRENNNVIENLRVMYDTLPAVFFCSLSRFQYVGLGEKLYDKFTFPRFLYMDRYLRPNLEKTSKLREIQEAKRAELSEIRAKLAGLKSYPHGDRGRTVNLIDTFQTVLNSTSNTLATEPPLHEFLSKSRGGGPNFVRDSGKVFPNFSTESFPGLDAFNEQINEFIQRMRAEEAALVRQCQTLENEIDTIYDSDEDLMKHKYELHAMIIHTGEMNRGHYWTYKLTKSIDGTEQWEKLNDKTAEKIDYEKIEAEAFGTGSSGDTSAYLLLYVRSDADWLMAADSETSQESFNNLPSDLQELVLERRRDFHARLNEYRETKAILKPEPTYGTYALFPTGALQTFNWYRNVKEMQSDENANPDPEESLLANRLDSYEVPVAEQEEITCMNGVIQHLWQIFTFLDPEAFVAPEDLLEYHLRTTMEYGGLKFIEFILDYPIKELRVDAENDVEKAYDAFIMQYVKRTEQEKAAYYRSQFVVFVATQLTRIHVPVIRYLLVRSMVVSNCKALKHRAEGELQGFINHAPDKGACMAKIAQMLVHLYHLGTLTTVHCRFSLESISVFLEDENSQKEKLELLYNAMIASKNARFCNGLLREQAAFLEQPTIHFVDQSRLEACTILSMLASLRLVLHALIHPKSTLHELEANLTSSGHTMHSDLFVEEICFGLYRLHHWANGFEHDPSNSEIDMKGLYTSLFAKLEILCVAEKISTCEEKFSVANRMLLALISEKNYQERLMVGAHVQLSNGNSEYDQVDKFYRKLDSLQSKVDSILRALEELIQKLFG